MISGPMVSVEDCDPGIQDYVWLLRAYGFDTTDSGDGVSKPQEHYDSGEALPFAHVFVNLGWESNWGERLREARALLMSVFKDDTFAFLVSSDSRDEFAILTVLVNPPEQSESPLTVAALAERMHDVYERVAAGEGWETQKSCRTSFAELPGENRRVMLRVARDVFGFFGVTPAE